MGLIQHFEMSWQNENAAYVAIVFLFFAVHYFLMAALFWGRNDLITLAKNTHARFSHRKGK